MENLVKRVKVVLTVDIIEKVECNGECVLLHDVVGKGDGKEIGILE